MTRRGLLSESRRSDHNEVRVIFPKLHSSRRLEACHRNWIRLQGNRSLFNWNPLLVVIQFYGYFFVIIKLKVSHKRVYLKMFSKVYFSS